MKGLQLRSLSGELLKVVPRHAQNPAAAIKDAGEKLWPSRAEVVEHFGGLSIPKEFYRLPLAGFKNFSFDELCKIYYASTIMMHTSVCRLFETNARYEIVCKIKSSTWRWGAAIRDGMKSWMHTSIFATSPSSRIPTLRSG